MNDSKNPAADAGGLSSAAYQQVNKSFDEEKFHAAQGHGYAAERANTLFDRFTGHDARVVGDDNAKNGADRIVDGVYIQSKYCATGQRCVNECFDTNGQFRYYNNGKPMQIEVPSDMYDAAVAAMEEKIRNGQVKGVTDPAEAKNIIRKGHFTYQQALRIAKAGTIESLTYDAVNGTIVATTAFGVTAVITFAVNMWNGEDFNNSLKLATYSGLKVGGVAFATTVIAGQLSKAGLNSALVGSSEAIVALMGPKASAILINAFRDICRDGSKIYGAAAMKSAAKLLRGNVITSVVTVGVFTSVDVVNIFRGRISGRQLFKNTVNTAATVVGGTAGWLGGAAVGQMLIPIPGVGAVVGGLIGSIGVGGIGGKAANTVMGEFIEDDAEEMVRIIEKVFSKLSEEYLINSKEAEQAVNQLQSILTGGLLKNMFASSNREEFAKNLLTPIMDKIVSDRKIIHMPSNDQMIVALKDVLEEINDSQSPA